MVLDQDIRTGLIQREALPLMIVEEVMRENLPTVLPEETLEAVLEKFSAHDCQCLAVVDTHNIVHGVLTRQRLMTTYRKALGERG